ncbi:unnamed protein product [Ambrosiozyma monospora]|uniref:Unnamed protein product n=1 Tax=Ambrosiozyma monospora TaxID=43982 RepID=A0ACB5TB40_AMBMO|nr:unnamed protein product [Ambrosiozyma monospora]
MSDTLLRTPRAKSSLSNPSTNGISSGAATNFNSVSSLSIPSLDPSLLESTRKRQSKKDDQIRRKIEHGLKKKNSTIHNFSIGSPTKRNKRSQKHEQGTVMSLKPSEPVICKPFSTVYEAAQLMTVTKVNCVLVVNEDDELAGIFTAKDLAFRVVGGNLNANQCTIDQIMTPNPMCAKTSTMASDALALMVSKGFRHLPVIDDASQIVGVLDITKCYNEAMTKLERMYESSKKLYDAMEGVNAEIGSASQPVHVVRYFENLKSLLSGPTLSSVLDDRTLPVYCDIKTNVFDAANLMRENKTTAVLVKDNTNGSESVAGIFTSKDIVLRVIATGLEPKSCSVVRVMTPKPSYGSTEDSIHHALRQMFEGRYLNLPVTDPESRDIVGIVDVLKLTHHTLNQIQTMQAMNSGGQGSENGSLEEKEGPAWNRFWTSMGVSDNDTGSITGSHVDQSGHEVSDLMMPYQLSSLDMVKPSDSISYVGLPDALNTNISINNSKLSLPNNTSINNFQCDYDEPCFFKFKSPLGRSHRISLKPNDGLSNLKKLVESKLTPNEISILTADHTVPFAISYIDDEHDVVSIGSDQDLKDCVHLMRFTQKNKVDLYVHNPDEKIEGQTKKIGAGSDGSSKDLIHDLILPGSITLLAATIVTVFALSKHR